MWFCSAREEYSGMNLFTAELKNDKWTNWQYAGDKLNKDFQVGEMHLTADGNDLYFHSARASEKGGYDIWASRKIDGKWHQPENVGAVNAPENEGWPFLTYDGNELWFTRTYRGSPAIFVSSKVESKWSEPVLILSQFAAEPSLDDKGNIYFAHHFYNNMTKMIEADMYVVLKK